jgi:hypothetical protein
MPCSDKGNWSGLCEVKLNVMLQNGSDWVTASSAAKGFPAANLVDGDIETRWAAQGSDQWVQFKLDPKTVISRIGLTWYNADTRKPKFEIETSEDGKLWLPVNDLKLTEKGKGNEMTIDIFKKVQTPNRLVEWEMPVTLKQPGTFQITLTPIKRAALISGIVLEPVGKNK